MTDLIRQTRYQFLLGALDPKEAESLTTEYEYFEAASKTTANLLVPDDMTADQFAHHLAYSWAGLNAEGTYKSVTHELAHGFSWRVAVAGDDYWEFVWQRHERIRRNAAAAVAHEVRQKGNDSASEGDKLAKAAFDLQNEIDRNRQHEADEAAARDVREATHRKHKLAIVKAREEPESE